MRPEDQAHMGIGLADAPGDGGRPPEGEKDFSRAAGPQRLSEREERERERLREALTASGGSRSKAALMLGMGRSSLWRKMKKYHLDETF